MLEVSNVLDTIFIIFYERRENSKDVTMNNQQETKGVKHYI